MAFRGKGIGVEGYEGIFGVVLFEGVVEGEKAREVGGVGYEGCPDLPGFGNSFGGSHFPEMLFSFEECGGLNARCIDYAVVSEGYIYEN